MRKLQVVLIVLAAMYVAQAASLPITPTTTLAAETANNTSAANSWTTSSNGDLGASNISKVDHRSLLYPGANTQIYSQMVMWFGSPGHIQVGYNSDDYTEVQKQVDDHLSRGISGTIVDWYGTTNTVVNGATLYLKQYAESLSGYPFKFAIMEDKGALSACANTAGCNVTAQLISDLTYVVNTYGYSPAYMTVNGRPVLFSFGLDAYSINWAQVAANVPGNPVFVFQNSAGFTHADSAGSFAWVMIDTSNPEDWMQSYLDGFYSKALTYPSESTYGATYKGFNDTLASWSADRIMDQQCGQVWLNTWGEIGKYYSAGNQLGAVQVVTWNDYEEGTEIETGIDNCLSITGAVSGNTLSWTLAGNENTLDHYIVFISTDGSNLMPLTNVSTGIHTLDLSQFGIGPGNYIPYVKAVGKPSILNHMSPAVSFTVPGVAVLQPVSGATVASPVTFVASAYSSKTIATMRIYVDSQIAYTVAAASLDTSIVIAPGTHNVVVQAWDASGAVFKSPLTITVPPPTASLSVSPSSTTTGSPVTALLTGNDPDGTIQSYRIDFGDGTVATGPTAVHAYAAAGSYSITGTITDNGGLTATATATVTITAGVTISSPTNGAVVGSPVQFVASAAPANTAYPITSMRIYVDNVSVYLAYANKLDTSVALKAGGHSVVVQAWDSLGNVYKTAIAISVN